MIFCSSRSFSLRAEFLELDSLSSFFWMSAFWELKLAAWDFKLLMSSWVTACAWGRPAAISPNSMTSVIAIAPSRFAQPLVR